MKSKIIYDISLLNAVNNNMIRSSVQISSVIIAYCFSFRPQFYGNTQKISFSYTLEWSS